MLVDAGITGKRSNKCYAVFTKYITDDFTSGKRSLPLTMEPSDYVSECWKRYQRSPESRTASGGPNNSLNGTMFEIIIMTLLYREGVLPFYANASVTFVPNVEYDIMLYSNSNEIHSLSIKTSSRERYKQADLEALALKSVHRTAKQYYLTLDRGEAESIKKKIRAKEVMYIDKVILANEKEMNVFIKSLKKKKYTQAGTMPIMNGAVVKK